MINQKITLRNCTFHTVKIERTSTIGNIIMVHGYGEHIGRYTEMMEMFANLKLNVYGYDRRGEGRSEGRKGYVKSIDNQVQDLKVIRSEIIKNNLPTFIYGHSLGGLITTKYLMDHQDTGLKGCILSGPLLKVDDDISPLLQKVSGIVAAILPKLPTVKVDTKLLSRNPAIKPAYEADPYVYHGGTLARTGDQILKTTAYVQANFHKIVLPILITHGGADKLADPKGSQMMYDGIGSSDKSIRIFEGLYHEIMHEPEKLEVFNTMKNWLKSRI